MRQLNLSRPRPFVPGNYQNREQEGQTIEQKQQLITNVEELILQHQIQQAFEIFEAIQFSEDLPFEYYLSRSRLKVENSEILSGLLENKIQSTKKINWYHNSLKPINYWV